jgi:N4-(beta-N-acetylglucosaminyl)-L-asparaginase
MDRRTFIKTAAAGAAGVAATTEALAAVNGKQQPVVISSPNGLPATEKAMQMLRDGADTLDAVIAGVNILEEDPNDMSVGYGGLPNENGVVQLDSSVMHGPTHGAGSVAALENIINPSKVAKMVMERTDHVLLVGEGALRFAVSMGFEQQDLLTDQAREVWMKWKRNLSDRDDWIDPEERLPGGKKTAALDIPFTYGTINCNAVDANGDISGVTTTSGLSYKIPGRVGDSPIIGAGLYVDNDVGACGSTGRGEANMKTCASFLGVEFMRNGDSPEEAGLKVLKRIAENTTEPYLLDDKGRPNFGLAFYLVNKKGEFAGTSFRSGRQYAAHDGKENKLRDFAYLYD